MKNDQGVKYLIILLFAVSPATAFAQTTETAAAAPTTTTGKAPVIIVPGLTGSELVNGRTGEEVWFRTRRAKDDDLRLPVGPNLARNRDSLVPRDIIRSVRFLKFLPETEIYERLIEALNQRGYKEGKWNAPSRDGHQDTFYVFPYDWRRDNVETARLFIRRIEALKRRLGKPNLKFNVIAHSMGGLVTRYAIMYGGAEPPARNPSPTWAGARHFNKVFLVGTPNEGTVASINALLNGFSFIGGGLNLPFIQNISRFDVFTIPSIYQLLPHEGSLAVYDEDLKPVEVNIYDPETWEKFDWAIWQDDDFTKKFTSQEQRNARSYFREVLARAYRFQAALNANNSPKVPVEFHLIGADCKDTSNAMLIRRDEKKNRWITQFNAASYTRANGEKVTSEQLKPLLYANGDSVVPKRSLSVETMISRFSKTVLPIVSEMYQCEGHSKLVTNPEIQGKLFDLLNPAVAVN